MVQTVLCGRDQECAGIQSRNACDEPLSDSSRECLWRVERSISGFQKTSLGRIQEPSDFNPQDAAMSNVNLDANDIVTMFQVRATAELRRELDEVKWWEDRVRRGFVKRQHAERYIQASKRIIRTKRHILGIPEFPC